TLNYTVAGGDDGIQMDGQSFIIQNDARTLDVQNEWYYNPTSKKLRIYSTSEPSNVKISTIDTLAYFRGSAEWLEGVNYVNFENLVFEGANTYAVVLLRSKHITSQKCEFRFIGKEGVRGDWGGASSALTIDSSTFN